MNWLKFFTPKPKIKTAQELADKFGHDIVGLGMWIVNNISYAKDHYPRDEFRMSEETLRLGYGDCDDFAKLEYDTLRKMGSTRVQMLTHYPIRGNGHAITVFKGFETPMWWWYDNGILRDAVEPTDDEDADFKTICDISGKLCGWKVATWHKVDSLGMPIGE